MHRSAEKHDRQSEFRKLPAVDALLRDPQIMLLTAEYGQQQVADTIRGMLSDQRQAITAGASALDVDAWPELIDAQLAQAAQPSLRPLINATGVIVHTNLGRAPLSTSARAAMDHIAGGYSNLEYDLEAGKRGSRHDHARTRLCSLTGAEDALVVNNNAAAVYLVLAALCDGRDVLISRGQLVEIGGGFRIPDVLRQSGARLVEVGTTNRTHARDYADAAADATAAIMRVHSSNFRQIGFVTEPDLAELAAIAHDNQEWSAREILLIDDLGSGTLLDTREYGLAREPMVQESLAAGADLVTFSGDKLLGGPQAGLIVGKAETVEELRRHPMARALRVDKSTLAALDATLGSYQRGKATEEIPVWRMIGATVDELRSQAEAWRGQLAEAVAGHAETALRILPGESTVGGGSLPGETLPTWLLALAVPQVDRFAARLRAADPAVVCRVQQDCLVFDPRTVLTEQENELLAALQRELAHG